jgi:hypothetical protein
MLFLQNIPTSQKVTLRNLLDSDNAEMMNHPLMRFTSQTGSEDQDLVNHILNTYFTKTDIHYSHSVINLFQQWSPRHFFQIYQNIQNIENKVKEFNGNHNFFRLITMTQMSSVSIFEYFISKGYKIHAQIYIIASKNRNVSLMKWFDSISPMSQNDLLLIHHVTMLTDNFEMYTWIYQKYESIVKNHMQHHVQYVRTHSQNDFLNWLQMMGFQ